MDGVVFFHGQLLYVGKVHFTPKTEHTGVPVSTGQDNRVPFFVDSRGSISQVGNRPVLRPGSASVEAGRVAPAAEVVFVENFSLLDDFLAESLLRRLWNMRDDVQWIWKRSCPSQLESQQS